MIKVIIAEDDFRVANIHEGFLQKIQGVKVVGKSTNGKETLQMVKEVEADLLLLDIYLPDILGTDLIKQLREVTPKLDIVMITAATEIDLLEDSLKKGVVNYVIKPASFERFKDVFEQYRERKRLLEGYNEIDHYLIDKLFSSQGSQIQTVEALPKGIDKITLEKVKRQLDQYKGPWSSDEMGQNIGSSRTTARRYLEYLVSKKYVRVEQEYGVIGRPERKYYANELCEQKEQN
ncbi:response regulator [Aquibacillus sediminis]|uniref:response regulator n=1 Tax=Aquibacillus sediminis TaxID=2574734 RepID=UPI001109C49A|nr:response regulator [Aquibacillus sediminis]